MSAQSKVAQGEDQAAGAETERFFGGLDQRTQALRDDGRRRRIAFVGAVVVGLGLAWIHWAGLVIAGALLGVTRQRLLTAVLAGFGFGVIAVALSVLAVPAVSITAFTTLTPLNYATLIAGVLLPIWGSLIRYVI